MPLLSRYPVSEVLSVAAARTDTTLFNDRAEFEALGEEGHLRLRIHALHLGPVRLASVITTGHRTRVTDTANATILLAWRGALTTDDGRREQRATNDTFALPQPGRRATLVPSGYAGLVAQVPIGDFRARAEANPEDGGQLPWPDDAAASLPEGRLLVRFLRHPVAELEASDVLLRSPRAAGSAAALLTDLLAEVFRAGAAARSAREVARVGLRQVRQAEAMIRERLEDPVSVAEVAAALGIGTRALQLAFQEHRGMTPRDFLGTCRLDAAHERLVRARPDDTVTDIAFDCGVSHLGRFAGAYRRRFGETPSETLARARRRG